MKIDKFTISLVTSLKEQDLLNKYISPMLNVAVLRSILEVIWLVYENASKGKGVLDLEVKAKDTTQDPRFCPKVMLILPLL